VRFAHGISLQAEVRLIIRMGDAALKVARMPIARGGRSPPENARRGRDHPARVIPAHPDLAHDRPQW
jgi:hypothetical protein